MLDFLAKPLEPNDRIVYTYTTKKSATKATMKKRGVFVRKVKHSGSYFDTFHRDQMAVVKFIGNENETRVRYIQLRKDNL